MRSCGEEIIFKLFTNIISYFEELELFLFFSPIGIAKRVPLHSVEIIKNLEKSYTFLILID